VATKSGAAAGAFALDVRHRDGYVHVHLVGELDVAGIPILEALRSLSSRYDADQVVLDCSRMTFVDVAGLGGLLNVVRRFGPTGQPILRNPSPTLRKVLTLTGTTEAFRLELDLDAAHDASLPSAGG
jgi:anti-sigma B factor antagonist